MAAASAGWRALGATPSSLRCSVTLQCGQVFNWRPQVVSGPGAAPEWCGVIRSHVIRLREDPRDTLFQELWPGATPEPQLRALLRDYFRLPPEDAACGSQQQQQQQQQLRPEQDEPSLEQLYAEWSLADPELFGKTGARLPGVRLIRQDPLECLISFICSSNNHISRIAGMLDRLRARYGARLCEAGGHVYYSFPELEQLAAATEPELRELGFGYRAKYVAGTVALLRELGGRAYLQGLIRGEEAAADSSGEQRSLALQQFPGVGRKVADCVALFSLDALELIPVDTHVLQIAQKHYGFRNPRKSLTPTAYSGVVELFRSRFRYAGWAHSVLFAAELPQFRAIVVGGHPTPEEEAGGAPAAEEQKQKPPKQQRKRKTVEPVAVEAAAVDEKSARAVRAAKRARSSAPPATPAAQGAED